MKAEQKSALCCICNYICRHETLCRKEAPLGRRPSVERRPPGFLRPSLGQILATCLLACVLFCRRLVVTGRKLDWLIFDATGELSQTVLDALVRVDLGKRDNGTPRALRFQVQGK